jgi:hypothetical protein
MAKKQAKKRKKKGAKNAPEFNPIGIAARILKTATEPKRVRR